jgi:hypothetical protein
MEPQNSLSWWLESLSRVRLIQTDFSHNVFSRYTSILSSHLSLVLKLVYNSFDFPTKSLHAFLFSPILSVCSSYLILIGSIALQVQITKLLICQFLCYPVPPKPNHFNSFSPFWTYVTSTSPHMNGKIQNIPDWCRDLYSSCGSAKHLYIVGLPCLVSQCAKLHIAGWTWAVFTRVYLDSCISLSRQSGNFWIKPRICEVKKRLCLHQTRDNNKTQIWKINDSIVGST